MRRNLFLTSALGGLMLLTACGGDEAAIAPAPDGSAGQDIAAPSLPGGIKLIEVVEKAGDAVVIPYSKYELPNGLKVILHEDTSDPLVHVDITYHVGSAREEIGKSGFAHFFEHMMFQGSENVADEEHFKIITEAGGTLNGTTNTDRTNYFQTVPSNQLEKMLWLEADRMGFLLPAVTDAKFENQRETVKNERAQRYDNRPYGLLFERIGEAMYPEGHPYSWSTIGYIEDLNRADLDDLKRFFLRWYGPNNATLTIGGNLDKQQTLEWIDKYFGSIPRGPEVIDPDPVPTTLDQDRYISMEDNVSLPLIFMSFPTVHARHEDEAPLDVLSSIMGDGRTSLLYKNLVKDGLAVESSVSHPCRELHCNFNLYALPNPASGKTLTDLEATIRASFEEFETRGVLDDDLARVKAQIKSSAIFGLQSVSGKVSRLAAYETFEDNANLIGAEIARYEAVTKDDVMRVYEQYIKDQPAVIMSIVPRGQPEAIAAPDSWARYERTIPERIEGEELALREPQDDFDRSIIPLEADENPAIKVPELWRAELANGIDVLGTVNNETPTTAISIQFEVGQRQESLEKLGLASLTADMLQEATQNSTNEELSNRLDKLGSSISIRSGNRFTTITISSLTEYLDETMAIARERLLEPGFREEDFARLKGQVIQGIEQNKKDPSSVAAQVASLLLYGHDNTFAWWDLGQVQTIEAMELEDVRQFYEENFLADLTSIIAVSSLNQQDVLTALSPLGALPAGTVDRPALQPFPTTRGDVIYLVDKPDAAQSEIRIAKRSLPFDATGEYYKAGLVNYALGGAFNSRINLNLREDKGYTYGARSGFWGTDLYGSFMASAGVRTDATIASIKEFFAEINGYQERGITDEELAFTQRAIGQSEAREYETPRQKLRFLSQIQTYDLDESFVDEQNDILSGLTTETVDGLAAELLSGDMMVVVVGDRAVIEEDLKSLGREVILLDEEAWPVN